ncbi:hypothetical protein MMC31_007437 [Peltigera leucophlebia]|nr:hypothetical protein [Peltigera leucophlebia]
MSDLDSWFKAREEESFFENLSETGLQTMKDYLYGNITPVDASYQLHCKPQYPGPIRQDYASQLIYLEKISAPKDVLAELYVILSKEFDSLLSESIEPSPYSVDSHLQWINFNAFSAQLTALNAVDSAPQAGPLCNMFYEEGEVQEQPVLFDLAVSAAAHAHDSLSIPCLSHLRESTHLGISLDPQVKKYARLAVARIQLAKWKWKKSHHQKQVILALQKVGQTQLDGNSLEQEFNGQALQRGKKRGVVRSVLVITYW